MKFSERFNFSVECAIFFVKSPALFIRSISRENIRLLKSAFSRHEYSTVIKLVRFRMGAGLKPAGKINFVGSSKVDLLELRYPGITAPVGISAVYMLEQKLKFPVFKVDVSNSAVVNFLLPQLDPLIMFGGYIACLQFIRRLQESGYKVRILLCESGEFDRAAVEEKLATSPLLQRAIAASEVVNITRDDSLLSISPEDSFICYSYWTGIKAHHLAQAVGKKFVFFLQEYESTFHSHDSCYAIAAYVYRLPHSAIFNTALLEDYFRINSLGVFNLDAQKSSECKYISFQHALTPTSPPSLECLTARKTKRLLMYGRPEAHARRNLFEIALIGLKMAVWNNVFDDDWEFFGVGTLGTEFDIELGLGRSLKLRGTLPQGDYGLALSEYDIGLSLMMAPHPSILPFEMASAGQVVVTNVYESRTEAVLRSISGNIEPCEADPMSVAESLSKAVARVSEFNDRVKGANLDWVNDWDQSFNSNIMEKISEMLV
jgi:hypothetical protein